MRGFTTLLVFIVALSLAACGGSSSSSGGGGTATLEFGAATFSINEGSGTISLNVTRTGSAVGVVTVNHAVTGGSATAGTDYFSPSGTLTWASGDLSDQTIDVTITDDSVIEVDETVTFTLSFASGPAVLGTQDAAVLTILDNDVPGTLQFSTAAFQVNESAGTATITVSRVGGTGGSVGVDYATSDGTATDPPDYTTATGTLSWAAGDGASKTFTVDITDDAFIEADETVDLALSNPTGGATLGTPSTAVLTLLDDEMSLQFTSATYSVGEAAGSITIGASRIGSAVGAVSIDYATSDGTATASSDYTAATGTLSWPSGDGSGKSFTLVILDDAALEGGETVDITLSNPTGGATIGTPATAVLTIVDDDSPGDLQFTSATYSGGEGGGAVTITASRTGGISGAVTVDYATSNGTATAPSDYTAITGLLSWADADVADKSFSVLVQDDFFIDVDETVNLTLSNPTGGGVLGTLSAAVLTIVDDDIPGDFELSSATYQVNEGSGVSNIMVSRVGGVGGTVSVDYGTKDGTAVAPGDYGATSGTLFWGPGDAVPQTFAINIQDDLLVEPDETVDIALSNPTGGTGLGTPNAAVLTIIDDDIPGDLQFEFGTYFNDESDGSVWVNVLRTGGTIGAIGVDYATSDGTATAGSDYTATSGTLTWPDGDGSNRSFQVPITNDTSMEGDETFGIALSNPTGGAGLGVPNTAVATIFDDDGPGDLQFSMGPYQGDESGPPVTITVSRVAGVSGAVSVDYATSDGTATAGSDYGSASGTLNWADGDTADKTFQVVITDDSVVEGDETVSLALSNPTGGASLGWPDTELLTILDDDASLQFSTVDYQVMEDGVTATITATRAGSTAGAVSVDYTTTDDTATDPDDYTNVFGTLNWAAGDGADKTFPVSIADDAVSEPIETLDLSLSNPVGASLGTPFSAVLTIIDDDGPNPGLIQFALGAYTVSPYGGTHTIDVSRIGGTLGAVSVDYASSDASAVAPSDYTPISGTLNWIDGDGGDKSFQVNIIDDVLQEEFETFMVTLSNPTGGAVLGTQDVTDVIIAEGWQKYSGNPVFGPARPPAWDDGWVGEPTVVGPSSGLSEYMLYYRGEDQATSTGQIGLATSPDGLIWTRYINNPILSPGGTGDWDEGEVEGPRVLYDSVSSTFMMYYTGGDAAGVFRVGLATSPDGMTWTPEATNPVLPEGGLGDWDEGAVAFADVVKDGAVYKMWFTAVDTFGPGGIIQIGYATSPDGVTWTKFPGNPVMSPNPASFEVDGIGSPCVIIDGSSTFRMLYRGNISVTGGGSSAIGYARSLNGGITWEKYQDGTGLPQPTLDIGPPGDWDDWSLFGPAWETLAPSELWYDAESQSNPGGIGYATHE